MLRVRGLQGGYGESQVLFDVTLDVAAGEVVTLLGRNGMGKTTTILCLTGILPPIGGTIDFVGEPIQGLSPFRIARKGIGLVPEGRQIFPNLTVKENLVATASNYAGGGEVVWTVDRVLELFPTLANRLGHMGSLLSGGEQQMLAIGRALMTNPRLLILDEATEGLAPLVRNEIWQCLRRLKAIGQSILIVDKNVVALTGIADRHYFIDKGRTVHCCTSEVLRSDTNLQHRYLGI
jgi:branched-chain amino acid transport system ATP-binding protein